MSNEPAPADAAAAPHGRAGRNLVAAIGAGVVLGGISIISLFTVKWLFGVVALIAISLGITELRSALAGRGAKVEVVPLVLGAAATCAAAYLGGVAWLCGTFAALVLALMFLRLRHGTDGYVRDTAASIYVAAYLPFMVGFVMLMLREDDGPQRVVAFVLLTVCSDIGGYAAGVLAGRHPIAPGISPKKSWEGLVGSLVLQAVAGALIFVYLFQAPAWQGVVTGLAMTVVATLGDFAESAVKRDLGVKDMGTILPGHGGMMDRLDSLVPNAFTAWLLLTIFLGA